MTRCTDENYRGALSRKTTGAALLSQEEVEAQSRTIIERAIVKLIAKKFRLNLRAIGEAVKNETTEFDYQMHGVHLVYAPKFPVVIQVVRPQRGKGQVFILYCPLQHPENYSLVGHFLTQHSQNLNRTSCPAMLVGTHPRLGLLVVTDLKMDPDVFCFHFSVALARVIFKPLTVQKSSICSSRISARSMAPRGEIDAPNCHACTT